MSRATLGLTLALFKPDLYARQYAAKARTLHWGDGGTGGGGGGGGGGGNCDGKTALRGAFLLFY